MMIKNGSARTSVTMEDIARVTRLSKMTVSRALNNTGYVSKETREKVVAAAQLLNYEINMIGRQLNQNRTGLIGVITPFEGLAGTYYFGQVMLGVQRALDGRDYHLTFFDSLSENFNDGQKCAQLCHRKRVDALIVVAPHQNDRFVKTFTDLNVPLIVVGSSPSHKSISFIDVDNYGGGAVAVDHLIGLGHRKIGYVRGPANLNDSAQRELAFRKTMARHDVPIHEAWMLQGDFETRKAFHAAFRLLGSPDRPTAIFAANDLMALGVLDAAVTLGLKVPEDISIVGFDDLDEASKCVPPMTTIRQRMQELGKTAGEYLLEILNEPKGRYVLHKKLSTHLVLRASTAEPSKIRRRGA